MKYWCFVWWLLIPCAVNGLNTKKADKWFGQGAYYKALEEYRSLLAGHPDDPENGRIFYRVGVCHLRMGNYRGAQEWLERAVVADLEEDEVYNRLGEAYLYLGEYVKAKEAFRKYQRLNPDDERLENRIASCDFALKAPKVNPDLFIEPFPYLNTSGSEYGILFVHGGILYSSTGDGVPERKQDISPRTGLGYSKPYLSFLQEGEYQPGILLKGISRKHAEEGSFAYDAGSEQLFCTRCENNSMNCEIIKARLKGFHFEETGVLKIKKGDFNLAHPFVGYNGARIYFSSTMEGGYGGADLWYMDRSPDGRWSDPENLGPEVNTPGNEVFPYIWEGTLFFASDGHVGYGGLDLFRADPDGELWKRAQNLGAGMNTSYDDFNLIMHRDGRGGLFVSNRDPGQSDDIFRFEIRAFVIAMRGTILDLETGQPLEQASVELSLDGTAQSLAVNAAGRFSVNLTHGVTYRLTVTAPGYQPLTEEVKAENFRERPFDREYNRLERSYFMQPSGERYPDSLAVQKPEEPKIPAVTELEKWEELPPPEERSTVRDGQSTGLKQVLNPARLPYEVEVKEGELTDGTAEKGWWVQVAMLRESESLPAEWMTRLFELTGKQVVGYRGADRGKRFYLGVYPEEQEARRIVALLKENGFDCFIKQVTE